MKLTYWHARFKNDSPVYDVRKHTKHEAVAERANWGEGFEAEFGPVAKVTIEYTSAFDLMQQCLSGEDRGHWEWDNDA